MLAKVWFLSMQNLKVDASDERKNKCEDETTSVKSVIRQNIAKQKS